MKDSINVWEKRRVAGKAMPREDLMAEINRFIKERTNCSLATGYGTYVRNTPMRYSYKNGEFFFITEGGYKFKGLSANPHVCIAIFDSCSTGSETYGLTVEGIAKVTEIMRESYTIKDDAKYMITVTPTLMDYLNSKLPLRGYYQLQRLTF